MQKLSNTFIRLSFASLLLTFGLSGCGSSPNSGSGTCTAACPVVGNQHKVFVVQQVIGGTPSAPTYSYSVLQFAASANGAAIPLTTLTPPTGVGVLSQAVDASGNLYLAGAAGSGANETGEILVYSASNVSGTATPNRIITGTNTQLNGSQNIPFALTTDSAGNIYSVSIGGLVTEFSATANGNVQPTRTLTTGGGFGIAVDAAGVIYVPRFVQPYIDIYAVNATGAAAPIRTISGAATGLTAPQQVAVDATGQLYVAQLSGIVVFASGATGNATPVRTISGTNTTLKNPQGVAVDSSQNIYIGDVADFVNNSQPTLDIFNVGTTGNVAPSQQITSTQWTIADNVTVALY
jgi:hypothetical protein